MLVSIVVYRVFILQSFGFRYTDADQAVLWLGLKNYSLGLFHEPRFYGQNYNSMMESLLAVPLYLAGLPAHKALPVITSLLAILPFLTLGFLNLRRWPNTAIIVVSLPLLLPFEYDLISSLPRGFVTGIAISSITLATLFYPYSKGRSFIAGLSAVLAYSLNPNAIYVVFFCLTILLWNNYRNKQFYLYLGAGILSGLVPHVLAAVFYQVNPSYVLQWLDLWLSSELILYGISNLDEFLNYLTPIFWNKGWLYLVAFILGAYYFYRQKRIDLTVALGLLPLLIIAPLALSKVHDGTESIYFSYSRMYLALPVVLAAALSFMHIGNKLVVLFCLLSLSFMIYKVVNADHKTAENLNANHVVNVSDTERVLTNCSKIKSISNTYDIDLIIIYGFHQSEFINYGCPAVYESFPITIMPSYERRAWVINETENKVYKNILLLVDFNLGGKRSIPTKKIDENMYLISNNKTPTKQLLKKLKIPVRPH